jgi:hypothetical protein
LKKNPAKIVFACQEAGDGFLTPGIGSQLGGRPVQADAAKNENVPGVASSARASSELTPATLHEISSSAQHDNTYMSTKKKRKPVSVSR